MTLLPARKGIYLSHPSSLEHDPRELIPGHPDVPERLLAIEALLGAEDWLGWERRASPAASKRELELIHDAELVAQIERLAKLRHRRFEVAAIVMDAPDVRERQRDRAEHQHATGQRRRNGKILVQSRPPFRRARP